MMGRSHMDRAPGGDERADERPRTPHPRPLGLSLGKGERAADAAVALPSLLLSRSTRTGLRAVSGENPEPGGVRQPVHRSPGTVGVAHGNAPFGTPLPHGPSQPSSSEQGPRPHPTSSRACVRPFVRPVCQTPEPAIRMRGPHPGEARPPGHSAGATRRTSTSDSKKPWGGSRRRGSVFESGGILHRVGHSPCRKAREQTPTGALSCAPSFRSKKDRCGRKRRSITGPIPCGRACYRNMNGEYWYRVKRPNPVRARVLQTDTCCQ